MGSAFCPPLKPIPRRTPLNLGACPSYECGKQSHFRLRSSGSSGSRWPPYADCLRALLSTWRRRLPTIKSSPGCNVMEIICNGFGWDLRCLFGSRGMRARTPLGLLSVSTSILGSPSLNCWAHCAIVNPNFASSHITDNVG